MMRVICRFKILAIIVLTFFVMSSKGQIYQVMPQFGYKFNRVAVDSTLHIPSYCGVPSITDYIKNGMIAIDTCNNVLFQWTRSNGWTPISTGTYLDTTSLSNRINQRVKYTDTSAMLLPYLKKIDTTTMLSRYLRKSDTSSLSNRINLKLNISDTSILSNRINLKLNILDTTSMLSKYLRIFDTTSMLTNYVRKSTTISTTAPLTGGGNLTTNRTISIPQATISADGYLSSTDWDRFRNTLTYIKPQLPLYRTRFVSPEGYTDSLWISMFQANSTRDGYLSSTDWNTFNNKLNSSDTANKWVNWITKNATKDSIIFYIGNNRYGFKDSSGGGSTIDTTNKFVNNVIKLNDSTISVYKGTGFTNITLSPSTTVTAATRLVTTAYNNSGATIAKGSVVYINGRHSSNYPTIAKSQANTEANSYSTFAMVQDDITNGSTGTIIQAGNISNLNLPTATYTDGQIVYLSPTVAGGITTTKPLAPNHIVKIGTVTRAHPTLGSIELKIENGWQLDELSDVKIAAVPLDSTILQFSRVDSLWHDVNPTTAMGNRFVKNISRVAGKDSIIFTIGSTRYAIKDSVGVGGGGGAAGPASAVQYKSADGFMTGDANLTWKYQTKKFGIGTDDPKTTLDVTIGTQDDMPRNYEVANFSKNGDTKLGVYTSDTYASGSGSSITLGNSKNLNADGYYPGFEFQNINDSLNSGFVRYNYFERDISGNVVASAVDLMKINSSGQVQINGFGYGKTVTPRLVVGEDNTGDAALEVSGKSYLNGKTITTGARVKYVNIQSDDVSSNYNVTNDDHIIIFATNNDNSTITLPSGVDNGRELVIKQAGDVGYILEILTGSGTYINAENYAFIDNTKNSGSITMVFYDTEWYIINGEIYQ